MRQETGYNSLHLTNSDSAIDDDEPALVDKSSAAGGTDFIAQVDQINRLVFNQADVGFSIAQPVDPTIDGLGTGQTLNDREVTVRVTASIIQADDRLAAGERGCHPAVKNNLHQHGPRMVRRNTGRGEMDEIN